MNHKLTINELVAATQLSRATIDRVLNNRPGVNPKTIEVVKHAYSTLLAQAAGAVHGTPTKQKLNFSIVTQAGKEFNESLKSVCKKITHPLDERGVHLKITDCSEMKDEDVVQLLEQQSEYSDGIAIIAKNTPVINTIIHRLRAQGKHIVALVSDLEPDARDVYVGINNRAAGQAAGFILGRHLQRCPHANVAVIVGTLSYRCHDDREIGFRSQLRQTFPSVSVLEVVSGNDNTQQTYEAAKQILKTNPDLHAVYNVAGGNYGLAAALDEFAGEIRPIVITHEINTVTEPLIREGKIDYIITQNMQNMLLATADKLSHLQKKTSFVPHIFLPIEILTRFTLG